MFAKICFAKICLEKLFTVNQLEVCFAGAKYPHHIFTKFCIDEGVKTFNFNMQNIHFIFNWMSQKCENTWQDGIEGFH